MRSLCCDKFVKEKARLMTTQRASLLIECLPVVLLLVNGYWLMVIGYWLLVIGYWLLVIGYWLLVIGYWLLVIGYWLMVIG